MYQRHLSTGILTNAYSNQLTSILAQNCNIVQSSNPEHEVRNRLSINTRTVGPHQPLFLFWCPRVFNHYTTITSNKRRHNSDPQA